MVKAAMGRKGTLKTCSTFRCILSVAFEEGCLIIIKRSHQRQSAWVFIKSSQQRDVRDQDKTKSKEDQTMYSTSDLQH